MTATLPISADPAPEEARPGDAGRQPAGRWQRLDAWTQSIGDSLNPILVKESRQALKSRQFVVTFSLLLLASLGWSVAGSMMLMPQIYFVPSAPTLLIGYYLVLAVPMLLVVPLAAYRSLAAEIDDGTLELLTVTALSPMQVVTGKLASAALQMMLYFVALVPCVAYAYALRGVDMPTIFLLLAMTLLAATLLTVIGIFLAPMASGRSGQLTVLVSLLVILVSAEFTVGWGAITLISYGLPTGSGLVGFSALAAFALVLTSSVVLMTAAAAQLTPPSENRSTRIRLALFAQQLTLVGFVAYGMLQFPQGVALLPAIAIGYALFWTLIGAMMAAESPALTPRIRRDLPLSFASRLLKTWFMPGPATGLVFAVANVVTIFVLALAGITYAEDRGLMPPPVGRAMVDISTNVYIAMAGYIALLLVLVRGVAALMRTRTEFQPSVGLAILVVVALLMSIVPYLIQMHLNDYRSFGYSLWQVTNWVWTMQMLFNSARGGGVGGEAWIVLAIGCMAFLTHLALLGRTVLPQRLATPERVRAELRRLQGDPDPEPERAPIDPLAAD